MDGLINLVEALHGLQYGLARLLQQTRVPVDATRILHHAELPTTDGLLYTAPTKTRTYVREINVCNTNAGANALYLRVVPPGGSSTAAEAIYHAYAVATNTTFTFAHSLVLEEGWMLYGYATLADMILHISGTELPDGA